ncbi:MAG: PIN domain-containing protein [Deltaproteobacteria bacterium]|nr:PIN domain-containing protein [Deltaproteobacteria bacterium]
MPDDKIFVDTNVFIYSYDVTAGEKHIAAGNIMQDLWNSGLGMTSTQVLQEFFVNVVNKIPKPINGRQAREIVHDLLKWQVVVNTGDTIIGAIDIHLKFGYSFWDSMIIEAAITGGAEFLMSEDLQDGQIIGGVTIKNPFSLPPADR